MEDPAWSQGPLSSGSLHPQALPEPSFPWEVISAERPDLTAPDGAVPTVCSAVSTGSGDPGHVFALYPPRTPESLNVLVNMLQTQAGWVRRANLISPASNLTSPELPRAMRSHTFSQGVL